MARRARTKWPTEWTVTFTCLGVITMSEAIEALVPICEQLLEQHEQRCAGQEPLTPTLSRGEREEDLMRDSA